MVEDDDKVKEPWVTFFKMWPEIAEMAAPVKVKEEEH
jgi:hypothetical protein